MLYDVCVDVNVLFALFTSVYIIYVLFIRREMCQFPIKSITLLLFLIT